MSNYDIFNKSARVARSSLMGLALTLASSGCSTLRPNLVYNDGEVSRMTYEDKVDSDINNTFSRVLRFGEYSRGETSEPKYGYRFLDGKLFGKEIGGGVIASPSTFSRSEDDNQSSYLGGGFLSLDLNDRLSVYTHVGHEELGEENGTHLGGGIKFRLFSRRKNK